MILLVCIFRYNGDTDTVCNFLGDEWFQDDRNQTVTKSWREWYYTDVNGQQVGGWTQDFERVHFVTGLIIYGIYCKQSQFRIKAISMLIILILMNEYK